MRKDELQLICLLKKKVFVRNIGPLKPYGCSQKFNKIL